MGGFERGGEGEGYAENLLLLLKCSKRSKEIEGILSNDRSSTNENVGYQQLVNGTNMTQM